MTAGEPAYGVECSCTPWFTASDPRCKVCGPAGIKRVTKFNIFSSALCARALRRLASVGSMPQRQFMHYFNNVVGGKAKFTFAFDRFACSSRNSVDCGSPNHLILRERIEPNRTLLRWLGAAPADWIAALSDDDIYKAFTDLERQFTLDLLDAEETIRWTMLVRDEKTIRANALTPRSTRV